MEYNFEAERPHKDYMRSLAISHGELKSPAKYALFLPGLKQTCIKLAVEQGLVNRKTFIVAVEGNKETAKVVNQYLSENFNNYYLHEDSITTLDLGDEPFQYVFADFCGQMTKDLSNWLKHDLFPSIENGGKVAFTFHVKIRNNPYLDTFRNQDASKYKRIWPDLSNLDSELATLASLMSSIPSGIKRTYDEVRGYRDTRSNMQLVLMTVHRRKNKVSSRKRQTVKGSFLPSAWASMYSKGTAGQKARLSLLASKVKDMTAGRKAWITKYLKARFNKNQTLYLKPVE